MEAFVNHFHDPRRGGNPHRATIEAIEGDAVGFRREFQTNVTIGRSSDNLLELPCDEGLADHHVSIGPNSGHWICTLDSPEAITFVDGVRVTQRHTLIPPGSVVRFGRQAFRVTYFAAKSDPNTVEWPTVWLPEGTEEEVLSYIEKLNEEQAKRNAEARQARAVPSQESR